MSWKAYCFADTAERDAWRAHTDDLSLDEILETRRADFVTRRFPVTRPDGGAVMGHVEESTMARRR